MVIRPKIFLEHVLNCLCKALRPFCPGTDAFSFMVFLYVSDGSQCPETVPNVQRDNVHELITGE